MCYRAILPTTAKNIKKNSMLLDLTYTFNRWLKMLGTYGKLDATTLPDDLSKIARFL